MLKIEQAEVHHSKIFTALLFLKNKQDSKAITFEGTKMHNRVCKSSFRLVATCQNMLLGSLKKEKSLYCRLQQI